MIQKGKTYVLRTFPPILNASRRTCAQMFGAYTIHADDNDDDDDHHRNRKERKRERERERERKNTKN